MSELKPVFAGLIWVFVLLSSAAAQHPTDFSDDISQHPSALLDGLAEYQLLRINDAQRSEAAAAARNGRAFSLDVGNHTVSFALQPLEVRSPDYVLMTSGEGRSAHPGTTNQFSGSSPDGGKAVFTITPAFLMGHWSHNGDTYALEPLWLSAPTAPRDVYVSYRAADLTVPESTCGVTKRHADHAAEHTAAPNKNDPGFKTVDVAVVIDSLFYRHFANDDDAEEYTLGLLALVQRDFDRGFDNRIKFRLSALLLSKDGAEEGWTTITDSERLLERFMTFGNSPDFDVNYDVATLMTGRDLAGRVIGVAFLDAVCDTNRYNIVQDWYPGALGQRAIWAHELGHNFGAQHTVEGRFVMSPTSDQNDDRWASATVSTIERNVGKYACLESFGWQYLRVSLLGGDVRLDWEFADQNPHDGFLVQRAETPDGPWSEVKRISDRPSDVFREVDNGLSFGRIYYYRVIQLANDGTPCVSKTRKINVPYLDGGRISPNPTNGQIRVYSPSVKPRNYKMHDATGRILWNGIINQGANLIDLSSLPAGVYFYVEAQENKEPVVERIIRQ